MLLDKATAEGTKTNYNSKWTQWTNFCEHFNLNPHTQHSESTYLWYSTYRFLHTSNKYKTVKGEISGILSLYNDTQLQDKKIDRKTMPHLENYLKDSLHSLIDNPSQQCLLEILASTLWSINI